MRLGTPGFIGPRLRQARQVRGITAPALAKLLDLSRAAISQYENDQTSPGFDVLRRMCIVLNQPSDFFLKPLESNDGTIFFRSRAGTTTASRLRAAVLLEWLADIAQELWRHLTFPPVRFEPFAPPADPFKLTHENIEQAASATRRYWELGDGPVSNMVWLLENQGAIITRGEIDERYMDSFSRYDLDDPCPYVFLNADKASAVRSRFDAAHEVGHFVLHRGAPSSYWSNDAKIKARELQAHKFAGAFLLPSEKFASDIVIPSLDTFLALKPKWGVSINAMLVRCEDIGLVSEDHATRLWRSLAGRGWRTREPLDDEMIPEQPRLLPKAIEALRARNPQAATDFARMLSLSPSDLADLVMLPLDEFLPPEPGNMIKFPPPAY